MTPLLAQRPRTDRAFERLYRRHVSDVYRYSLVMLQNPADAEDVTQTTFMNAYRAFQRGDRPSKPQNWLISIAHNVCRQRFRQSARRPQEVAFDGDVEETVADEETPNAEEIRRALSHLAFNQRAALIMRELEGRSYAEIADVLDVSVGAVETLIFRARRALREQLEGGISCGQAELAVSKQLDGRLPRAERGALRAHLRECTECAAFARRQRAQRAALKGLAVVPLPGSLSSFFGDGAAQAGASAALGGGAAAGGGAAGAGASAGVATGVATKVGAGLAAKAGIGFGVKAAAVVAAGAVVGGGGYQVVREAPWRPDPAPKRESPPVREQSPGLGLPGGAGRDSGAKAPSDAARDEKGPGRRPGAADPQRGAPAAGVGDLTADGPGKPDLGGASVDPQADVPVRPRQSETPSAQVPQPGTPEPPVNPKPPSVEKPRLQPPPVGGPLPKPDPPPLPQPPLPQPPQTPQPPQLPQPPVGGQLPVQPPQTPQPPAATVPLPPLPGSAPRRPDVAVPGPPGIDPKTTPPKSSPLSERERERLALELVDILEAIAEGELLPQDGATRIVALLERYRLGPTDAGTRLATAFIAAIGATPEGDLGDDRHDALEDELEKLSLAFVGIVDDMAQAKLTPDAALTTLLSFLESQGLTVEAPPAPSVPSGKSRP